MAMKTFESLWQVQIRNNDTINNYKSSQTIIHELFEAFIVCLLPATSNMSFSFIAISAPFSTTILFAGEFGQVAPSSGKLHDLLMHQS